MSFVSARPIYWNLASLLLSAAVFGPTAAPAASLAERSGSTFLEAPADPYQSPRAKVIEIPIFPGDDAIWGSTGRDSRGHIWFGVSANGGDHSAHLMEYDPDSDQVIDRGDVISELKAAELYKPDERQIKIHSRIVPADDGYLYFSSTDEQGEKADGSAPPKWGSHLWRLRPGDKEGDNKWEHLFWVQEGLTAVAGAGRWIYALGLWDHVLYQYDTQSGNLRRVVVGSVGGHMSRNLIADLRGHVYVPRLQWSDSGQTALEAALVEFDSDLKVVGETPLENYAVARNPGKSHGITGLTYLADGSMVIAVNLGDLYRITPRDSGPAEVTLLGNIHPIGRGYAASLFTFAGERYLVGPVRQKKRERGDKRTWVWAVFDLETRRPQVFDFPFPGKPLLYGSIARDTAGRFYAVGRHKRADRRRAPLLLQIDVGP